MHESHLMNDLLKKIESVAQSQGAGKVSKVKVRLGALSNISEAHFREHFVLAVDKTPFKEADLEVEMSGDIQDPNAQQILLESVEIET